MFGNIVPRHRVHPPPLRGGKGGGPLARSTSAWPPTPVPSPRGGGRPSRAVFVAACIEFAVLSSPSPLWGGDGGAVSHGVMFVADGPRVRPAGRVVGGWDWGESTGKCEAGIECPPSWFEAREGLAPHREGSRGWLGAKEAGRLVAFEQLLEHGGHGAGFGYAGLRLGGAGLADVALGLGGGLCRSGLVG
jgi:hypothetical protein